MICRSSAKRSLILPSGQELICSRPLNRCVPPFMQTRVHTRHTATGPDLHPKMLASAGGKEQMEWLGSVED